MPVANEMMPPDVPIALQEELWHYFSADDPMRKALSYLTAPADSRRVPSGANRTPLPQLVHVLAAQDIADAESLQAATRRVGWRFLTMSDKGPVASYVAEAQGGQSPRLINVQHGDRLQWCLEAALTIEQLLHAQIAPSLDIGFTLRLLRIPAMYIEALWLLPDKGGQEYVLPYRTMLPDVPSFTLLTADAFLAACKAAFAKHQSTRKLQPEANA